MAKEIKTDIFDTFTSFEDREKQKNGNKPQKEVIEESIGNDKKIAKNGKQDLPEGEKHAIFFETTQVYDDYISFKAQVTNQTKRKIIENIIRQEMKKTFGLDCDTPEAIERESAKKMEDMRNMFL